MNNRLQTTFIRFHTSILVGFVLFFLYSIYSFITLNNLHSSNRKLQNINNELNAELKIQKTIFDITNKYIRTKLPEFSMKDLRNKNYSTEMIKNSRIGIVLLILSDCGDCIENEIPIWNNMYERLIMSNIFMVGINTPTNRGIAEKLYAERATNFSILQGDETYSALKTTYPLAEIITFVVKPDLEIVKLNVSIPKKPEKTIEFVNQIIYDFEKKIL